MVNKISQNADVCKIYIFLYTSRLAVVMHKDKEDNGVLPHIHAHDGYRTRELGAFEHGLLDGDMFLQVSPESS